MLVSTYSHQLRSHSSSKPVSYPLACASLQPRQKHQQGQPSQHLVPCRQTPATSTPANTPAQAKPSFGAPTTSPLANTIHIPTLPPAAVASSNNQAHTPTHYISTSHTAWQTNGKVMHQALQHSTQLRIPEQSQQQPR